MLDPSIQLLLACATPSTDGAQIAELLSRSIDWELVLERAHWHCVLPLVYRSLHADAGGLVPQAVITAAQASFEENFHKNLFLSAQMIRLADGFRERNIPAIAYKGPVLCTYYGQLGLREFGDLDFLVAPKDVAGADDYLRQEGFHPHLYKPCAQEPRSLPFARAFHYELVYTNAASETKVDLHWALMPGFWPLSDDAAEVWMHRRTISLGGGSLSTLSHEGTLLLLCAHGTKHMWSSLGWICDVAALLHSVPDLDWSALAERAKRLRILRAFGLGLHLASDLLDVDLPPAAIQHIEQDPEIRKLAAVVRETLFTHNDRPDGVLKNCSFLMRTRENAKDAIHCAAEQIFQPTMAEWKSIALPKALFPAYYLLRPARLLAKHVFRSHPAPPEPDRSATSVAAPEELTAQGFYAKKQLYLKDALISWSHRRRFDTGLQLVRQFQPKRLLDYGCGDGTFLALLEETSASLQESAGCELLDNVVSGLQDRFRSMPNLRFHLVQEMDDEANNGRYDLITCIEVLEHVVDTRPVIDRLRRLLTPHGRLIVSVPVETGAALVLKQAARRIAAWRGSGDYRFVASYNGAELFASLAPGAKQHIPRSIYEDPDGTYFHDHKGFNWRVLRHDLERVFRTERILCSPFPWLPAMASQVWLILTRQDLTP